MNSTDQATSHQCLHIALHENEEEHIHREGEMVPVGGDYGAPVILLC